MDWATAAGLGSLIASVMTLITVSYHGGRLAQRVDDHSQKFQEQTKINTYVDGKLDEHNRQIGKLTGYHQASRDSE